MLKRFIPVAVFMFCIVAFWSSIQRPVRASETICVKIDAMGNENGDCWENAYTDLQSALNDASFGDEIWVAAGTYFPTDDIDRAATFQLNNGVAIYGGFNGTETERAERNWEVNITTLSGDLNKNDSPNISPEDPTRVDNSYHVISSIGIVTATLDGFVITGGNANGGNSNGDGGGMYNDNISTLTIKNVVFVNNSAGNRGGAIYNKNNSSPSINNTTFINNWATNNGGGMYNKNSSPSMDNVTFTGNLTNGDGGGMYNVDGSNPTIRNTEFISNVVAERGGGIFNYNASPVVLNSDFIHNVASNVGGGMYNTDSSSPTICNVTFFGNSSDHGGGGIYNNFSSSPRISNVIFYGNLTGAGGGIFNNNASNPEIGNVTLTGNLADDRGGGIYNNADSRPIISNSILWNNRDTNGTSNTSQIYDANGGETVVVYSIVQGDWIGDGNIDQDPGFVNPVDPDDAPNELGDFRLRADSPAIDAGDNHSVFLDECDLDGDSITDEPLPYDLDNHGRFSDNPDMPDTGNGTSPIVDMGIYEYSAADLELSQVADNPEPNVGDTVVLTVSLTNAGPNLATNVKVTNTIPSNWSIDGVIASIGNYNEPTWSFSELPAFTTVTLTMTGTVNYSGIITNTTELINSDQYDPDSTPGNHDPLEDDQKSIIFDVPEVADLELDKAIHDPALSIGDFITFTVTLYNWGPDLATNVAVSDTIPDGLSNIGIITSVGSYNGNIWNIPNLSVSTTATLMVTGTVNTLDKITNMAEVVSSDQFDPDSTPGNNILAEDDQDLVVLTRTYLPVILRNYCAFWWETEPNDNALTEANGPINDLIVSECTILGKFPKSTDIKDYFYFDLTTPRTVDLKLTNILIGHNYALVLRNESLEELDKSNNPGNADEYILFTISDPGRYYIQVYNYSKTASVQEYHLQVTYK